MLDDFSPGTTLWMRSLALNVRDRRQERDTATCSPWAGHTMVFVRQVEMLRRALVDFEFRGWDQGVPLDERAHLGAKRSCRAR